jgi:DNA-binding response OmpR family regulator
MAASAILLVDDDRDCCASRLDIISDLGYPVGVAYDGPTALEQARRQSYGLALLAFAADATLPPVDFSHLLRLIEEVAGTP